jgi:hypothetical protein
VLEGNFVPQAGAVFELMAVSGGEIDLAEEALVLPAGLTGIGALL